VLIHVPEREDVLARLPAAVRPGGLLMVEEDDIHPVVATASGAYRKAWHAFLRTMRDAGVDLECARGVPERLAALGLEDVGAEITQLFRGGADPARFWSLTWEQVRERIAALGVPHEVIDRGQAVLEDPERWFHRPAKVIAWGRRPAAA
jgi:hypothetical protein